MLEIRNFASPEECWQVITAYERVQPVLGHPIGDPFFDYRVLLFAHFLPAEIRACRALQSWRRRAVDVVSRCAGRRMYSDTIQVVRWDEHEMPPHQDDRHPDGSPHPSPWRAWASVIYLNDDYLGGEIYFPDDARSYKPAAGAMLVFEGWRRHAVRATTLGIRYTSPGWYASDPAREDPLAAIDP